MVRLQDLSPDELHMIPIFGREVRALVLTCRYMSEVFGHRLYHGVLFQRPESAHESVDAVDPVDRTHLSCLSSPRAIHLWLHSLASSPRIRHFTRRVYLFGEPSLQDCCNSPIEAPSSTRSPSSRGPARGGEIPSWERRRYDWGLLGTLPRLEHVGFSSYWKRYFVLGPCRLPALQSVYSVVALPCQVLSLSDPDHFRTHWEVADLKNLLVGPSVRGLHIVHGCLTGEVWPGIGPLGLDTIFLDRVEVRGGALQVLLQRCPSLRNLRWRQLIVACRPGEDCHCDEAAVARLHTSLLRVRDSLTHLHLQVCSPEYETWRSPRCLRNQSILPTVSFLSRLRSFEVEVELLLGRRVCQRQWDVAMEQSPPEALAAKLPAGLHRLTVFVHIYYATYERGFRRRLSDGILGERSRLPSLSSLTIVDRAGNIYDEDGCGQCAVHGTFYRFPEFECSRETLLRAGIDLSYRPVHAPSPASPAQTSDP